MTVEDLLAAIRAGGDDAKEAAVTLGLLIERGTRGPHSKDDDIAAALSPDLVDRQLTDVERWAALEGLADYVTDEPAPLPLAVWALAKSVDRRVVPALIAVLERTVDNPEHEHLAYQALTGVIPIGGPNVDAAVRDAAKRGHGDVRDSARQYLRIRGARE